MRNLLIGILSCLPLNVGTAAAAAPTYAKWSTVELRFQGPPATAAGDPNPFAIRLDATFTAPSGRTLTVPGFYDGDGQGGGDGDTWRVRFSADELGTWSWQSSSDNGQLAGQTGRFEVTANTGPEGFAKWGRLEYPGTAENGIRYFKFRDGPFWLKAGCDDPENFLGKFKHFDTLAQRKQAIDYLAGKGVNSLYIMTHNLGGDDNDVWPWLGATPEAAQANGAAEARFDIPKLTEWRELFEYMQQRGVVPYLILEDDSAWKKYDHDRYHRELIARFGDLPAIIFNLGEEHNENYSLDEGLALAARFKQHDPYPHPLGIHNISRANADYVDSPHLDFTSIQTGQPGTRRGVAHAIEHNQIALDWIALCRSRGKRVLAVNFDEGRPEHDRRAWWSAYLAGAVWEAHVVEPYDQPLSAWDETWTQLGGTRKFMESLPFYEMQPRNDLILGGQAFCLAQEGQAYACYLPAGGTIEIQLADEGASYRASWWDPASGFDGQFRPALTVPGGRSSLTAPSNQDWALRIVRPAPATGRSYFPPPDSEGGWRLAAASSLADPAKLDEAFEVCQASSKNGGLLVLKDGWLVYEEYFGLGHREATPNLASCGKSFTSIAIGILMDERPDLFPAGLDQKIISDRYLPAEAFPLVDVRMSEIRLGQLLAFTAGIRGNNPSYVEGRPVTIDPPGPDGWQALVDEIVLGRRDGEDRGTLVTTSSLWCDPGDGYSYATASIHLASIMLRHLTGGEMERYIERHLAQPLGWGRWGFGYRNAQGVTHTPGGGGIALRATDMLRFGYLLLQQGRWGDRQVVPSDYVEHCSRASRFNPHYPYSLQFTVNSKGDFADLPRDAFWKAGSGAHALFVVPSLKLVVWKLGGRDSQYSKNNTHLPESPAPAAQIESRATWQRSIEDDQALLRTLQLVVQSLTSE